MYILLQIIPFIHILTLLSLFVNTCSHFVHKISHFYLHLIHVPASKLYYYHITMSQGKAIKSMNLDCFDNNDIRRIMTMNTLIQKINWRLFTTKSQRKTKVWLTAVCFAHVSIFTARCIRNRNVLYAKNMNNNTQSAAVPSATTYNQMIHHLRIQLNLQHTKR